MTLATVGVVPGSTRLRELVEHDVGQFELSDHDEMATRRPRVALVNMPFSTTRTPSIQLGLLQAIANRRGYPATSIYLNLALAAEIRWDAYEVLCDDRTLLLGEWLFARAAFAERAPDAEAYLAEFGDELDGYLTALGQDLVYLANLRERVLPAFIDACVRKVDWSEFELVGFSSIFEQNCAALALARRLKAAYPQLITVFGGANFEDEMGVEYVRALPFIDYAVIGEGDEVFPSLLDCLAAGEDPGELAGIASRAEDDSVRFRGRAPIVRDLDALPEPDYENYFAAAAALEMPGEVRGKTISIPFETARGCWWGAKHHCTFCGLNGLGMSFRSKSPKRVLGEFDRLAERYAVYQLVAVDNILDLKYIDEVFAPLAAARRDYTFFYETKANLSHTQLKVLAQGGVWHLQPGIESLSTKVLRLMRKGTTGIQNVRLLKWGRYYSISVHWNVLLGFPGERPEDYSAQLKSMRLIPHLQPPESVGRIWLERYSPHYFEPESGLENVRPEPAYAHVYPETIDADRIAYFFAYEAPDALPMAVHEEMERYVEVWRQRWQSSEPPFLVYQRGAGRLTVTDGRGRGAARVLSYRELAARIYECCTPTAHTVPAIARSLRDSHQMDVEQAAIEEAIEAFTADGLMLEEDGSYLSLAIPVNSNW